MVPSLFLLSGYDIKKAIGTSLSAIIPAAFVGAATHYVINSSNIFFLAAVFLAAGSVAGSWAGSFIVRRLHSRILTVSFSIFLAATGLKQLGLFHIPATVDSNILQWPFLLLLGSLAGTCSAMFGVGGGVLLVPFLSIFFGLNMHQAIATSLIVIVPTSIAGVFFHSKFNNVEISALRYIVPSSFFGAVSGAVLSNRFSSPDLQLIFGAFLIIISISLFFKKQ